MTIAPNRDGHTLFAILKNGVFEMEAEIESPKKTSWIDRLPYPQSARAYWTHQLPILATLMLFSFSAIIRLFTKSGYC